MLRRLFGNVRIREFELGKIQDRGSCSSGAVGGIIRLEQACCQPLGHVDCGRSVISAANQFRVSRRTSDMQVRLIHVLEAIVETSTCIDRADRLESLVGFLR